MAEYIEREAAIKEIENDAPEQVGYSREDAADCIRYMPAADVAPVRHGRWVKNRVVSGKYRLAATAEKSFRLLGFRRISAPTAGRKWTEALSDVCQDTGSAADY